MAEGRGLGEETRSWLLRDFETVQTHNAFVVVSWVTSEALCLSIGILGC